MDTLIALGATAAFGYSVFALFAMTGAVVESDKERIMYYMNQFYFESAATILTLITVGKMLEAKSKGKTTNALKALMNLAPETAVLLVDGKEISVPVEEVKVGDFVTVTIESVENGFGETKLSREKAKRAQDWVALEEAMESGEILSGLISGKVKGGLTVLINSIRAFLPGSLIDVRPIKDTSAYEGKEIEFKVIKFYLLIIIACHC